jgi:hypothetical protein
LKRALRFFPDKFNGRIQADGLMPNVKNSFFGLNTSKGKRTLLGIKQKVYTPQMLFILKNEKHLLPKIGGNHGLRHCLAKSPVRGPNFRLSCCPALFIIPEPADKLSRRVFFNAIKAGDYPEGFTVN